MGGGHCSLAQTFAYQFVQPGASRAAWDRADGPKNKRFVRGIRDAWRQGDTADRERLIGMTATDLSTRAGVQGGLMLHHEAAATEHTQAVLDKRFSTRYPVKLPILFSGDLVQGKGTVFNISRSGCGLRTSKQMGRGLYVHLLLRLPRERIPLKVELAAVRWAKKSVCGVEFIRMSRQQQKRLDDYLHLVGMVPGRS